MTVGGNNLFQVQTNGVQFYERRPPGGGSYNEFLISAKDSKEKANMVFYDAFKDEYHGIRSPDADTQFLASRVKEFLKDGDHYYCLYTSAFLSKEDYYYSISAVNFDDPSSVNMAWTYGSSSTSY